jgi:glycine cleavage system H protein
MDAFSYSNIFQTKGIEYIIIIAFLILIVPFWQIITKPVVRQKIQQVVGYLSEKILKIPRGLQYSKNHVWAHLNKSGEAVLGIDDLLNHLVGEVEIKPVVEEGSEIRKGDKLAELEKDGKKLELFSPISGKILGYNTMLLNDPSLINAEPYDNGWLAHIEPKSWIKESSDFVTGEDAVKWESEEFLKFKDFMAHTTQMQGQENAKLILQAGGEMIDNPLSELPQDVWTEFQKQFLNI